jgi:hypothetical protein
MDKEDAIRIAQKVGLMYLDGVYEEALVEFASLVAAAERRACAYICDDIVDSCRATYTPGNYEFIGAEACATAIRARNRQPNED